MSNRLWRKLLALGAGILILTGGAPVTAAQAVDSASVQKADTAYYQSLQGENGKLTGSPSLTIAKFINLSGDIDKEDTDKPIKGVTFQYVKVGDLYEVTYGTEKIMAYGVTGGFATAAGLIEDADYQSGSGEDVIYYFKDPDAINAAVRKKTKENLASFLTAAGAKTGTTGVDGTFTAKIDGYGLYLIVESDTSGAYDVAGKKAISITRTQRPFVAALPRLVEVKPPYWEENVTASVKNSTGEAETEKRIVTGTDGNGKDIVADTDTVSIGDTVKFRLEGTIPAIPSSSDEAIQKYVLTDHISKGLTPVLNKIEVKAFGGTTPPSLTQGTDFKVSETAYTPTVKKDASGQNTNVTEPEYAGGKTFTITFETAGLIKLNNWAKDGGADERKVYFYYSATVNEDAVIGPKGTGNPANSGNPNEVQLTYKIGTSAEMTTGWDKVTVYTFGIDLTKQLAGSTALSSEQKNAIVFVLYKEDSSHNKTYYTLDLKNGIYYLQNTADSETNATKLNPQSNGLIAIRGLKALEDGSFYYLKELQTVRGYHILKKPVQITITADQGSNTYVTDSDPAREKEYVGTIGTDDTDQDGVVELAVNNTKGFVLPATGGAGIWLFVICGVLVIGAGCIYFMATKKKYEEK